MSSIQAGDVVERIADETHAFFQQAMPGVDVRRIAAMAANLALTPAEEAVEGKWKDLAIRAIDCVHDAERETSWGCPTFGPSVWERLREEQNDLLAALSRPNVNEGVTQADREAAVVHMPCNTMAEGGRIAEVKAGKLDCHPLVEAFRAHRVAALGSAS